MMYVLTTLTSTPPLASLHHWEDVCADIDYPITSGKDVYLKKCDVMNGKLWKYDTNTIGTGSLCMTYASPSLSVAADDVVQLTPCEDAATWTFYDLEAYKHEIAGKISFDKVHIVSMEDTNTTDDTEECLSALTPSLGSHVISSKCRLTDQKQDWATNELGQLFLKDYTNLCVQVLGYATGADVKMRYCDRSKQSQQFVFESNNQITPVISDDLCLTLGARRRRLRSLQFLRRSVTLERCKGSDDAQAWKFDMAEGNPHH